MIRVAVVDDHPIVRDGIATLVGDDGGMTVVARGGSATEALAIARETAADVMILDLELPDGSALGVISQLKAAAPGMRVVVFTAYGGEERVGAAFKAGADSYVVKGTAGAELLATIRAVAAGGSRIEPAVARDLVAAIHTPERDRLTQREREILGFLASGLANKTIAQRLGITERTVKFHVSAILARLGVNSRSQAVAVGRERGLI